MSTIDRQKDIATGVMEALEIVDPFCILAGGAPMDWYRGELANDLDIYFYAGGDHKQTWIVNKQLEKVLGECFSGRDEKCFEDRDNDEMYRHMKFIKRIINLQIRGMSVQLIEMLEPTHKSVVPQFASDAVKCWWKPGFDKPKGTDEFYLCHATKSFTICNSYSRENLYIQKLEKKLKPFRYNVTREDQLKSMALRKYVRGLK